VIETAYTYSLKKHFPSGEIYRPNLINEVQGSLIKIKLRDVVIDGDIVSLTFYDTLDAIDRILLDGNTEPVTGLIALHNPVKPPEEIPVKWLTPQPIQFNTPQSIHFDAPQSVHFDSPQLTFLKPINIGDRLWAFSHDLCDKTTWYADSIKVTEEVIVPNGILSVFNLAHNKIIDLCHGLVSDEDKIIAPDGFSYCPVVKKNGIILVEREFGEITGGDYSINYSLGQITFFTIPALTSTLRITYYYATNSTLYIRPSVDKKLTLLAVECQFSKDLDLKDEINIGIYTYNPALGAPPAKFLFPESFSRFKRTFDFINWTRGAFPIIPGFGGITRGFVQDIIQLRFEYTSPLELAYSSGAELRVWCKNHKELGGEQATFTCYGIIGTE